MADKAPRIFVVVTAVGLTYLFGMFICFLCLFDRGQQGRSDHLALELAVVSLHLDARNQTKILWKSSQHPKPLSQPSLQTQPPNFSNGFSRSKLQSSYFIANNLSTDSSSQPCPDHFLKVITITYLKLYVLKLHFEGCIWGLWLEM